MSNQPRTIRTSRDLGAFIYDARTQRKLTQEALATKANVSRSWLIGLEQGKRPRAEMDKILSLLGALDISLNLQTMQAHDSASEDQTPQDNSARSHHQQPSSHIPQATEKSADSASWDSRLGEVFKKTVTPHSGMSQLLEAYLSDQAIRPFSNTSQILGNVTGANMPNIAKMIGANTPSIEKAIRANIPNFGQASGITRALDHKEQKNKTADSEQEFVEENR